MTSPYYADDRVTLYLGDCREVLPTLGRFDAIITDPPFFMPASHFQSRVKWQRSWGDVSILGTFWSTILDLTMPHLKETGHFVTFCNGDSYPVFYPEAYRRFDIVRSLVWDKGRIGMGSPWRAQHELVLAARWQGYYRSEDRGRADVLKHPSVNSKQRRHPVDKPVGLLAELLLPIMPAGGLVLDPFAGGGSTLLAAAANGHRAVGVESEERYCEVIATRLAQGALDLGGAA